MTCLCACRFPGQVPAPRGDAHVTCGRERGGEPLRPITMKTLEWVTASSSSPVVTRPATPLMGDETNAGCNGSSTVLPWDLMLRGSTTACGWTVGALATEIGCFSLQATFCRIDTPVGTAFPAGPVFSFLLPGNLEIALFGLF